MADNDRRKILIASHGEEETHLLRTAIEKHVAKAFVLTATDGHEAQAKIENDPPLIVLVNSDLPKINGSSLTQWILGKKNLAQVCVVILAPIPDAEHFVDEVTIGRVQFLDGLRDQTRIGKTLARALNFGINDIHREFKLKFLTPEDVLIRENEQADSVYILRSGRLRATVLRDSKLITLGKIEAGEFVGEMAYINGEPRSADVTAETNCELIEIPINDLDHMLFQKPAWAKALMRTLSKRVKHANKAQGPAA